MKATFRFPTDQYAFVEVEEECKDASEAMELHEQLKALLQVGDGVTEREFNDVLDQMVQGISVVNGTEIYARMNERQRDIVQALKRSIKRVKYDAKKT